MKWGVFKTIAIACKWALLALALFAAPFVSAGQRHALVIGNSAYPDWPLINPANDANAISEKLKQLNFAVTTKVELKRDEIGPVTDAFLSRIAAEDTVVFFYAGHGVQVGGENFLLATDARVNSEYDVLRDSIDFSEFLQRLDATKAAIKLIFLDACRDNPYRDKLAGRKQAGLARVSGAPFGTLVSFSTHPGGVAADGDGSHGLYTEQLLAHLDSPQISVEKMLKRVALATMQASGGKQRPWVESSLYAEFAFNQTASDEPDTGKASLAAADEQAKLAWADALNSHTAVTYRTFLSEYADTPYASLAKVRLATLSQPAQSVETVTRTIRLDDLPISDLDGKVLKSVDGAAFDIKLTVSGRRLKVKHLRWTDIPLDAEGDDHDHIRCGFFRNELRIAASGFVRGTCGYGHVDVSLRGSVGRLIVNASYLAPGGTTSVDRVVVRMQLDN